MCTYVHFMYVCLVIDVLTLVFFIFDQKLDFKTLMKSKSSLKKDALIPSWYACVGVTIDPCTKRMYKR